MRIALVAMMSLVSSSRLGCGMTGGPCADGGACAPAIAISMPSLPAADFTHQPLAGQACVNDASCVSFTVGLTAGKVTCTPASGSGAQCTGWPSTFALTIPAGATGGEGAPVHLTLTDTTHEVVFDKTAPAMGGPPLGCGDCWAGYVSY